MSCCVAGNCNLNIKEEDLKETLELLAERLGHFTGQITRNHPTCCKGRQRRVAAAVLQLVVECSAADNRNAGCSARGCVAIWRLQYCLAANIYRNFGRYMDDQLCCLLYSRCSGASVGGC